MKKFTVICLAALFAAMSFVGCNSDDTYQPGEDTAYSVAISSFSLSADDKVLENLDTVFFSIDLDKAQIFNADSLPYGTPIDKLVPVIRMLDNVSKAELKVTGADGEETIHDYIENSTDTIDFSNGPVLFTVESPNGNLTATYTIKVNVHTVVSDSLVWSETARMPLPTLLENVQVQHTAKYGDVTYCLTSDLTEFSMAKREGSEGDWEMYKVALPENAVVSEFGAKEDALYILAEGKLFLSTDEGKTWSDADFGMNHIYGTYGNSILYAVNKNDVWYTGLYPDGYEIEIIEGMPVGGTSQLINFSYPLAGSVVATFIGGYDSDDVYSSDTWAFDGSAWAKINVVPFPGAYEGMTIVPFFVFTVSSTFVATQHSILLAFGGRGEEMNETVYISSDNGRTWSVAGSLLQLPDYFPVMQGAQAYIEDLTMGSRAAADMSWIEFPTKYILPSTAKILPPFMPASRATEPVTTWTCPYIYLYGGSTINGELNRYLWRGTINRLTFKPII